MNNNQNNLDEFFSFVSKVVVIIPIFVLIISLFLKLNTLKNSSPILNSVGPTVISVAQNNSFKFNFKGPIVCENLFIKDKKVLFKNKTINYLLNGDCLYIWEEGKLNGEKKCDLSNYISMAENYFGFFNINDLVNNNTVKDFIKNKNIDLTDIVKSCKKKNIKDDLIFEVPRKIIFSPQKMSRLRPTFPSSFDISIIGADSFHDLVRDGKGWDQVAQVTRTVNSI